MEIDVILRRPQYFTVARAQEHRAQGVENALIQRVIFSMDGVVGAEGASTMRRVHFRWQCLLRNHSGHDQNKRYGAFGVVVLVKNTKRILQSLPATLINTAIEAQEAFESSNPGQTVSHRNLIARLRSHFLQNLCR
jgi:hypothetical protein